MYNRTGQSMTSLLVGIAIMGCVGAGAAKLTQSTHTQEQSLSAKSEAGVLMDAMADEIRKQTRYFDLIGKYDNKTFLEDEDFSIHTMAHKICNASPLTNCDATHVNIEIVDKNTGETVLKQTVTRVYTHFEEPVVPFTSSQTRDLPVDAIAVRYTSDGGNGNDGSTHAAHGYDLKINSAACPYDYQPNSASPRPNGCERCPDGDWKQYHNGDCTLGRCDLGYKANAAKTGCEAITCPSGKHLEGDKCVNNCPNTISEYRPPSSVFWFSTPSNSGCCTIFYRLAEEWVKNFNATHWARCYTNNSNYQGINYCTVECVSE